MAKKAKITKNIPKRFKIFGEEITVKITDKEWSSKEEKEKSLVTEGEYFPHRHLIKLFLDKDTTRNQLESVFWHEVMEVLNTSLELDFPHSLITVLGAAIHQVLITKE